VNLGNSGEPPNILTILTDGLQQRTNFVGHRPNLSIVFGLALEQKLNLTLEALLQIAVHSFSMSEYPASNYSPPDRVIDEQKDNRPQCRHHDAIKVHPIHAGITQ